MRNTNALRASRVLRAACAAAALIVLTAVAAAQASGTGPSGPTGPTPGVTVRVEGLTKTLLAPTTVTLQSGSVTNDGNAADSCNALSALGALQDATKGDWAGTWSSSYSDYFVTGIKGTDYSATAPYYWAFWLDDKPASVGACSVDPAKDSSILFFPEYDGKNKSIKAPSVLGISAPAGALIGKSFTIIVTSYANSNGKPSPAVGAKVTAGSSSATVAAGGKLTLAISRSGDVEIDVSAKNSIRDETAVCIHKAGATCSAK
jgi:hypothetical protein